MSGFYSIFGIMEEKILYPGEDVQPIEVGEGYRDYWLSDVLSRHGTDIVRICMHYASEGVRWIDGKYPFVSGYCLAEVRLGKDGKWDGRYIMLAPERCFSAYRENDAKYEDRVVSLAMQYPNIRIRYMLAGDEVSRPFWISVPAVGNRQMIKDDRGFWVPNYSTEWLLSGYEKVVSPERLLDTPFIQRRGFGDDVDAGGRFVVVE